MFSIKDKVAIVTGGANGIGAHIVQEFIKEGAKYVAIVDVDEESGITLENKLKEEFERDVVGFFKCDITNDDVLHGVFDKIVENFGAIDIVVNNAAVTTEKMNTYKKLIEINFTATVSSTLKALELMRVDCGGAGGTIINVSSVAALTLLSPSMFIYAATKSAVLHLSACMGPNASAKGVIVGCKTGKSGSTWLINEGKIIEITERVCDAFKILSADCKIDCNLFHDQ